MNAYFADGVVIDWILALIGAEALFVASLSLIGVKAPELRGFLCNLLAGGFLLLALRETLVGADDPLIASCLAAAFVSHMADLFTRWSRVPARHFCVLTHAYRTPREKRHITQCVKAIR